MQNIVIANYSIHSIALIKWAKENLDNDFCVLSVDTGFQADNWDDYLQNAFAWLDSENIKYHHLKAENNFSKLVTARKQFPSQKFSWCAGFLKGITLLNKIDEIDPDCEATILLAHRKDMSKASQLLKMNKDEEEKYDFRPTFYPLIDLSFDDIKSLTKDISFCQTTFRSLECQPCIHTTYSDVKKISVKDIQKVIELETMSESYMFDNKSFDTAINSDSFRKSNILEELSKACSWEYSCGL
jgi:3'-phosphoadenosine 5'-phosphosulfate sulfotransferase (PAPS reductase)/FAD synthetase